MASLQKFTAFLTGLGIEEIPHSSKTYLGHLVAVHHKLAEWDCGEDVCLAGLFHSIYGTEIFQGFKLEIGRRGELAELIGARAERLAWVNCFVDRTTLDEAAQSATGPYVVRHRETGESIELTESEFDDLCRVHLADFLEQVPRSKWWDYRREGYHALAERLRGAAQEDYARTYALEETDT